jgi:hypothetical protein
MSANDLNHQMSFAQRRSIDCFARLAEQLGARQARSGLRGEGNLGTKNW